MNALTWIQSLQNVSIVAELPPAAPETLPAPADEEIAAPTPAPSAPPVRPLARRSRVTAHPRRPAPPVDAPAPPAPMKCGKCARFGTNDVRPMAHAPGCPHESPPATSPVAPAAPPVDAPAPPAPVSGTLPTLTGRERGMRPNKPDMLAAYIEAHPDMALVLDGDHAILRDMKNKVRRWGSLSDKQVALARKLFAEAAEAADDGPAGGVEAREAYADAPVSVCQADRKVFRGVLVSRRTSDGPWGRQVKCLIKVPAPGGAVWLAWGSCPAALAGAAIGSTVEVAAQLVAGRDRHFAIMKRPGSARVVAPPSSDAARRSA